MAKMAVIDVDLGQDINDIINDDVEEMTEQTRQAVDEAIAQKKSVETEHLAAAQLKLRREEDVRSALDKVYRHLLEATEMDSCLSLEEMIEITEPAITNSSALILQLKSFIRKEKGNAWVLKRRTKSKKPVYILLPFNAE